MVRTSLGGICCGGFLQRESIGSVDHSSCFPAMTECGLVQPHSKYLCPPQMAFLKGLLILEVLYLEKFEQREPSTRVSIFNLGLSFSHGTTVFPRGFPAKPISHVQKVCLFRKHKMGHSHRTAARLRRVAGPPPRRTAMEPRKLRSPRSQLPRSRLCRRPRRCPLRGGRSRNRQDGRSAGKAGQCGRSAGELDCYWAGS